MVVEAFQGLGRISLKIAWAPQGDIWGGGCYYLSTLYVFLVKSSHPLPLEWWAYGQALSRNWNENLLQTFQNSHKAGS